MANPTQTGTAGRSAYAAIDEFRRAMMEAGLEPPSHIEPGKMHRFPGVGKDPKNKAGWCRMFDDMRGGVFGDFSSGLDESWRAERENKPFSKAERAAFRKKCDDERRAREQAEAKKAEKAALKAAGILAAATLDPAEHPYAITKRVQLGPLVRRGAWPQRGWGDALLIPLYDAGGKIWTVEAINVDGEKDFLIGGAKAGRFHPLGKIRGSDRVVIGEGLATVAAGHAALDCPAIAAMDAGNLLAVAQVVRKLAVPGAEIIFLADDDQKEDSEKNPGIEFATAAALAVGGRVAAPGMGRKADFWDLWHEGGADAVRAAVGASAQAPQPDAGADDLQPPDDFVGYAPEEAWPQGAKILTLVPRGTSAPDEPGDDDGEILVDRYGQPISCALNCMKWLSDAGYKLARNEFTLLNCLDGKEISEEMEVQILVEMQRSQRVNVRKEHLLDAITLSASRNAFHPVREWLDSLRGSWDGTRRVRRFLEVCLGVERTDYSEAVAISLFMSAIERAMCPGSKVDTMLVLEGEQGIGKSTAIIELFSQAWHTEVSADVKDKDFYQNLRGKWCVEFGEMSGISIAESAHIKAMLTQRVDNYRASYARISRDYPRQNIFIGTTNDDAYLRDATGERRYLPVKATAIKIGWVSSERLQLWAEAVTMWDEGRERGGLEWWVVPGAADEQEQRFSVDPWEEAIAEFLAVRRTTTSNEILTGPLGFRLQDCGQREKNRVSGVLKRLGWACKSEWVDGVKMRIYRPKQAVR